MLHLFKHKDGKFDIALVVNGKYIVGSKQGYSRRSGCYKAMLGIMNTTVFEGDNSDTIIYQDDTVEKPIVWIMYRDRNHIQAEDIKPKKKYIPQ